MYKIGEFAGIFGLSIKTLRVYDRIGLLKPAHIDKDTGYRYYTPDQIQVLNVIIELKSIGFSLREIDGILKSRMEPAILTKMLDKKLAYYKESIMSIKNKIDLIKEMKKQIRYSSKIRLRLKINESDDIRDNRISRIVCSQDNHADRRLTELIWL